jgi:hypothetical protein
MLIDALQSMGKFMQITEARSQDMNFLEAMRVSADSILVFDNAYNYYGQCGKWTEESIYFVTKQKGAS